MQRSRFFRSSFHGYTNTTVTRGPGWLLALALAAAGCSGKDPLSTSKSPSGSESDDDEDDEAPDTKPDAGKPKADSGVKRDAQVAVPPKMPDDGPLPVETLYIDECGDKNAAGIAKSDVALLKAGGSKDGMRWLYPYDGTIFPRGLGAPLLMWEGGAAKAVYVHITADAFEYEGCLKPDADGRLQIPKTAWEGAERQTTGAKSPFTVELSTLDGKSVRGPIKEKVVIARATLKGSIYYNTYNTGVGGLAGTGGINIGGIAGGAGGLPNVGGTVERIKPGQPAEFFSRQGECTGCHAVSANGTRLITKEVLGLQPGYVFALATDTQPNPDPLRTATNTSFVGLSPDGSVYLTTAFQGGIGPPTEGALPVAGNLESGLFETDTGTAVPNSGFPGTALMPTFSADGTLATFNDYARGQGRGLSLMDYDAKARKASKLRDVYTATAGYTGWPFLLPDNGGIVFTLGDSPAFSGGGSFITRAITRGPKSDLMMVDIESGEAALLARAMGFATVQDATAGKTYLPFGDEELHQSYYPTVSPVAAGGYFWVFFDSIRHYGNLGVRRQLWGTTVAVQRHSEGEFQDTGPLYAVDLSSPAFYLPGQDFETANHRAFTALDPCLADGKSCETGIDCCSGFCTDGVCGPPKGCSKSNEACKVDDDCCEDTDQCIAGFCGQVAI
ncbi:MAG: hypothetical protein RLZZ450_3016 [Pseudomonadota bacterium]|jgi:hypothetical protein